MWVSNYLYINIAILTTYGNRWTYSTTLAYIVDANQGRSSTAVATNSAFRGTCAFIATEIAVPLQVSLWPSVLITRTI